MLGANRIGWELDTITGSSHSTASTNGNAPVTRVSWTCDNLPEGLTLSESGEISGHPTTAGTYACTVTVTTNWGSATGTVNIQVI